MTHKDLPWLVLVITGVLVIVGISINAYIDSLGPCNDVVIGIDMWYENCAPDEIPEPAEPYYPTYEIKLEDSTEEWHI